MEFKVLLQWGYLFLLLCLFPKVRNNFRVFFSQPCPLRQLHFSCRHILLVISEVSDFLQPTENSLQSSLLKNRMSVLRLEILHDEWDFKKKFASLSLLTAMLKLLPIRACMVESENWANREAGEIAGAPSLPSHSVPSPLSRIFPWPTAAPTPVTTGREGPWLREHLSFSPSASATCSLSPCPQGHFHFRSRATRKHVCPKNDYLIVEFQA